MTDISITAASVIAGSNSVQENGVCGETITAGQALYKSSTDGKWYKADNNGASAEIRTPVAIALNGGAAGQPVRVHKSGSITIGATLTAGVVYYLSDTPGGICPVADLGSGEYPSSLGIATSTTVLDFAPKSSGVSL